MPDTNELLTSEEVANHLSVSIRSVRRFADSGQLPPVRLGRYIRPVSAPNKGNPMMSPTMSKPARSGTPTNTTKSDCKQPRPWGSIPLTLRSAFAPLR